ncbi:MAG: aminotransferase class I/II-fold pyridoxal phosphate-dependent enzyme [Clostridia bacterium]
MREIEDYILPSIKNLPPSGIRKYFDMINEMQDVISLGVGEPDFVTPWNICEAGIFSLEKGQTSYSSNAGFIELRKAIADYLERRFDMNYDAAEEILVTVGGSEAIDIALRTLVGPGDEVIIPEPSFVAYTGCTLMTGATPVPIALQEKNSFKLTVEELEAAITPRSKVLILGFPNNPTGAIMTREELAPIAKFLKDKDIIVISDEIYAELTYAGEHASITSFSGMREKTIMVSGFSKAFAMTGWRIGYVCAPRVLMDAMKKIHQYALMCSPTIAQKAAIEAMHNGQKDVDKMVREYNRRRRLMVDGFRKAGLTCFEPLGAFYVFANVSGTGLSSEEFCDRLLLEHKVLMVPGEAFGESGRGFARATYATSYENIIEACKRIKAFTDTLK